MHHYVFILSASRLESLFSISDDLGVSFYCITAQGCWNIIIRKSPETVYTNCSRIKDGLHEGSPFLLSDLGKIRRDRSPHIVVVYLLVL